MNSDQIEGKWKQLKGELKAMWGKFTDDDLDVIAGKKDKIVGKLQEKYGISKEVAEQQLKNFYDRVPGQNGAPPKKITLAGGGNDRK